MEADKKAKDIYDKMKGFRVKNAHRKRCALICVDEMIEVSKIWNSTFLGNERYCELLEVKREIEKL